LKKFANRVRERGESEQVAFAKFIEDPAGRVMYAAYRRASGPSYTPPAPPTTAVRKDDNAGSRSAWLQLITAYQAAHPGATHSDAVRALQNTREGVAAIQAERMQKQRLSA